MKKLILVILFLFISIFAYTQEVDSFITVDDLKEITVLHFSSNEVCEKILNAGNIRILKDILYFAMLASVSNIVNHNTTRTTIPNSPYMYRYVFVKDLLEYETIEIDSYRYVFDPSHPDAILEGEMCGFVKYPDINLFIEEDNIYKITNILFMIK